jgi:bile acid:Na+ symporter, BASS family
MLLNGTLAAIMFGLGLSLTRADFRNLFAQPKTLILGLIGQMMLLPLIAWLLISLSDLSLEYKMGIMILSICPGGITSNLVSYFMRANVALSVSLTVLNAAISVFSIPLLIIWFSYGLNLPAQEVDLSFWETFLNISLITIVPATAGVFFRRKYSRIGFMVNKYLNWAMPVLLALIFGIKFFASSAHGGSQLSAGAIATLAPWVILLNVISMLAGFLYGKAFRLSHRNTLTITIEIGLHNTALALIVAGQKLQNPIMEQPALVYAMFSFFITLVVAFVLSKAFPFKAPEEV